MGHKVCVLCASYPNARWTFNCYMVVESFIEARWSGKLRARIACRCEKDEKTKYAAGQLLSFMVDLDVVTALWFFNRIS